MTSFSYALFILRKKQQVSSLFKRTSDDTILRYFEIYSLISLNESNRPKVITFALKLDSFCLIRQDLNKHFTEHIQAQSQ